MNSPTFSTPPISPPFGSATREPSGRQARMCGSASTVSLGRTGLVLLLVLLAADLQADDVRAERLRCEYLVNPLGIAETAPRLSWQVTARNSKIRGAGQSAYRVLVASSAALLANDQGDLWDSGRVQAGASAQVAYQGEPLGARAFCHWKVMLWDQEEAAGAWSEPAHWSVGLLDHTDWTGQWIAMADNHEFETRENVTYLVQDPQRSTLRMRPAKYFRSEFAARPGIRRALLYGTARGIYEVEINGRRVGDQILAPGWTDYDTRLYYQTYDVTETLRTGAPNAIGATLADGWYAGYIGYALLVRLHANPSGRGFYGDTPSLFLQLEIEYEDGSREVVTTDGDWKTSLGPVTETDILMGESYDARRELGAWTEPGFDDHTWEPVVTPLPYTGALQPHPGVPVRIVEELKATRILEPEPGVYIFDLGQNFSGIPRIRVTGPAGSKVRIRTGEMVRPDETLMTANLRCARSTDTYTCKGDGPPETWAPQFVYHGFQYVELTGLQSRPDLDAVTGLVMHSDTPLTSGFECSDDMLNQLFRNIVWTQRANFLEIPTDCPQRDERLGWTGDAQAYVKAAAYNADIAAFYKKWLVDLRDAQWDYGAYPAFAPRPYVRPHFGHGTAWMDAGVICPWTIWRTYGDVRVLEDMWQSMEIFMHFRMMRDPDKKGQDEGQAWGDWLNLNQPTPIEYIDLCYYGYTCGLMADMAEALGKTARAKHYRTLKNQIRKSFAELYLEPDGRLKVHTQTAYALAIFMDLLPPDRRADAGNQLAGLIRENEGRMATGFLGTRPLLPALSATGHHDLAGSLIQSRAYPSWGYEVVNGATTIWERWNSYIKGEGAANESMNSFSHYAFGAVGEWMFQNLVGIDLSKPGWESFVIEPRPTGDLTWVRAHYDSPRGRIEVAWKRSNVGPFLVEVTIPPSVVAEVRLPAANPDLVAEGGVPAANASGVQFLGRDGTTARFQVSSGRYAFTMPLPQ